MYFCSSTVIHLCSAGESATVKIQIKLQVIDIAPGTTKAHTQPTPSMTAPKSGHVKHVASVFPIKAATNFPFSAGGAHRDISECTAG